MLDISIIKDYLTLITAIIVAILTYFLGVRKKKQDKFNVQMEKCLEEIISPMFNEIRLIKREENAFHRQKLLKEFFLKYSKEDTKLFKMSSKPIHDFYYKTEELYLKFEKDKKKDKWDTFWVCFNRFYNMIDNEYNTIRENIYSDYKWLMDLSKKNCFWRITFEILILFFEGIKFLFTVDFIFLICIIFDNIEGQNSMPMYFKQIVVWILVICIIFYFILFAILTDYFLAREKQRRESIFKLMIKKLKRKISSSKIEDALIVDIDIEKEKKKIIIPSMYKE